MKTLAPPPRLPRACTRSAQLRPPPGCARLFSGILFSCDPFIFFLPASSIVRVVMRTRRARRLRQGCRECALMRLRAWLPSLTLDRAGSCPNVIRRAPIARQHARARCVARDDGLPLVSDALLLGIRAHARYDGCVLSVAEGHAHALAPVCTTPCAQASGQLPRPRRGCEHRLRVISDPVSGLARRGLARRCRC